MDFTDALIKELSSEFKKRRQYLQLTQTQLAKIARVSQSLIAKVEQVTIDPSYATVLKIEHALSSQEKISRRTAKELMTKEIIALPHTKSLKDALLCMRENDFSQLLISKNGKLFGTLYEVSILDAIAQDLDIKKTKVDSFVEMLPIIISPEFPVLKLKYFFGHKKTHVVLVGTPEKIHGLVTKSDLFKPE